MLLLAAAVAACVARGAVPTPQADASIAGTYDLLICKGACTFGDSALPTAVGQLILSDTVIDRTARPDSSHRVLEHSLQAISDHGPNGCFLFDRRAAALQSHAAIVRVGLIGWTWTRQQQPTHSAAPASAGTDSVIRFLFYRSPDARHEVTLRLVGNTLRGIGESSGAGMAEVDWPSDSVIARRVGSPDFEVCFAAAAAEWRRMQRDSETPWWLPQN